MGCQMPLLLKLSIAFLFLKANASALAGGDLDDIPVLENYHPGFLPSNFSEKDTDSLYQRICQKCIAEGREIKNGLPKCLERYFPKCTVRTVRTPADGVTLFGEILKGDLCGKRFLPNDRLGYTQGLSRDKGTSEVGGIRYLMVQGHGFVVSAPASQFKRGAVLAGNALLIIYAMFCPEYP